MTGWNLPPGCEVHHIPGNRPEDLADEAFWDTLFAHDNLPSSHLPEEWWDDEGLAKLVVLARDLGYAMGYADGQRDEVIAREVVGPDVC